ncbi:MAG: phosphoribosylanthranilate isomerase [Candidatus Omnitrophica bacterium]|nr:phosphoribosylanthranilate isomerase [Candidatus Omnitrophota bacterium]
MIQVKICGLTNLEDALEACAAGADLVGFLFAEASPRHISPEKIKAIIEELPAGVMKVGLFRDNDINDTADKVIFTGIDCLQLHGGESPAYCREIKKILADRGRAVWIIKTFRVGDKIMGVAPSTYGDADYYLFDTYHPKMMGGTGIKFDWGILKGVKFDKPFFLAGGLDAQNVAEAVRILRPYGVDVASGVEASVGKKSNEKLKEFVRNAKNA